MSTKKNASWTQAASRVPLGWPPANLLAMKQDLRQTVIFDLHGPILDWNGAFAAYCNDLYKINVNPQEALFYSPGYDQSTPISPRQFADAFGEFARKTREGYGSLKPHDGIKETLDAIRAAGIKVEIWTWVPGVTDYDPVTLVSNGSGIAQDVTRQLLEKHKLVRDAQTEVRFIKPGHKVTEMLQEHIPLIVEDHPVTAIEAGAAYGHAAILVPEPYNCHISANGVLRLQDRADLAPVIISFYEELKKANCLMGCRKS